jgi:multiple sugar transport system substrate-binding protein
VKVITLEFTAIPDRDLDYELQLEMLSRFTEQTGIAVKLIRMQWSNAWQELINISTHGQGADLSYVGSTWVSSLVGMNALRPIPPHLIARTGGEGTFVHSAWESVLMEEDRQPWAIPLSAYTYAVAYRRDLLEKAGLDAATAFATPQALELTVCQLEELELVKNAWLMPCLLFPFNDVTHTAASWIWSSGGHMLDPRGKRVLFDTPAALAGLKAFFKLLRRKPEGRGFGTNGCMQRLMQGEAAAVLTDTRSILAYLQQETPETKNIGTASVMSVPWAGGNNLVIWRHTYGYPDRLEATFKLAEFLTSKQTMVELARRVHTLPARIDAIDELTPPEHPLRPVMMQLISSSRSYRTIPLWRRIENQFGQELSGAAKIILEDKHANLDTVLNESMGSLTQRLNLTLE